VGATSAELLRRVNEVTEEMEWIEYRWAFKHGLARLVLALRADKEPPIALSAKAYDWARERGQAMADALAASGVRVVGDVSDLVPPEDASLPPEPPAPPSEAELLDAAIAGLAGLGGLLAEARIEHEALIRTVRKQVSDEFTPAEWDEFVASEGTLSDEAGRMLRSSRFLRWRLER
jgi:hypothetical protein